MLVGGDRGVGHGGLGAAIALKQAGLRVEVYDRSCVASSVASYPTYMTFFSTAEKIARSADCRS